MATTHNDTDLMTEEQLDTVTGGMIATVIVAANRPANALDVTPRAKPLYRSRTGLLQSPEPTAQRRTNESINVDRLAQELAPASPLLTTPLGPPSLDSERNGFSSASFT